MANTVKHQGIVENINGSHLQVRVVQTSACASYSIKGHCSSPDTKEEIIDVTSDDTFFYQPGDHVWMIGELSMGAVAMLLAFIFPFLLLVFSLFVLMAVWSDELSSALYLLAFLIPYYCVLWLNKSQLRKKFSFSVRPMNQLIHKTNN